MLYHRADEPVPFRGLTVHLGTSIQLATMVMDRLALAFVLEVCGATIGDGPPEESVIRRCFCGYPFVATLSRLWKVHRENRHKEVLRLAVNGIPPVGNAALPMRMFVVWPPRLVGAGHIRGVVPRLHHLWNCSGIALA